MEKHPLSFTWRTDLPEQGIYSTQATKRRQKACLTKQRETSNAKSKSGSFPSSEAEGWWGEKQTGGSSRKDSSWSEWGGIRSALAVAGCISSTFWDLNYIWRLCIYICAASGCACWECGAAVLLNDKDARRNKAPMFPTLKMAALVASKWNYKNNIGRFTAAAAK